MLLLWVQKTLDQLGRTGAYSHIIRRKATIVDMGLDNVKDIAKQAELLPLTGEGVLGSAFEEKLKDRKEKLKEMKDLVPELETKRTSFQGFKRKTSYSGQYGDIKQRRYNEPAKNFNNRSYGSGEFRSMSSQNYGNSGHRGGFSYRGTAQTKRTGVSSFRNKSRNWLRKEQFEDSCRGSTEIFHKWMGKYNKRSMDSFNFKRGLQAGVPGDSTLHGNSTDSCKCKKYTYYTRGNRKIIRKKSNRTCAKCGYIFPSSKENRGTKTSNKLKTPQQVSSNSTFQNGHFKQGHKLNQERRLGNLNRFNRRLSTHSHISGPQKVSSVLHKGQSIPIYSTSVRSQSIGKGVHKDSFSSSGILKNAEPKTTVYLDDWFLLNAVREILIQNRRVMLNLLSRLGFLVNREKSQLQPTQQIVYIGGLFDLQKGLVRPTSDRIQKIHIAIRILMSDSATAIDYLHALGLMASCVELIPFARLHMRPIQLHLLFFWRPVSRKWEAKIPISQHLIDHLKWWLQPVNTQRADLCYTYKRM